MPDRPTNDGRRGHVVLAGVGNIGAPVAMLLASHVRELTIVDRDVVEVHNLRNQWYGPGDVGRAKAEVVADRLRRAGEASGTDIPVRDSGASQPRTGMSVPQVVAIVADLEEVPLGPFAEADVVLGAVDSLRARQVLVSERAWPLGKTVVDGGVGEPLLGRVHTFVPGDGSGCLECPFGEADYAQLSREMPCNPRGEVGSNVPRTGAPAFLGTAVASLMVAETLAILRGDGPTTSRELYVDLESGRMLRSNVRRAAGCLFDHEVVAESLPASVPFDDATLGDLADIVRGRFPSEPLHVESRPGPLPGGERYATPDTLVFHAGRTLREAGFRPNDLLRVRTHHGSAWVRLDSEADR